jgi:ubiquinol-cytochrome c reductase cytochrome b subunit
MLRATTDLMVNVLCVIIALGRGAGLPEVQVLHGMKGGLAVAGLVAIALLKTFDAKFWGVVVMGGAVIMLFFLPWLDRSPARSIRYRPGLAQVAVRGVRDLVHDAHGAGHHGAGPDLRHASLSWLTNELVAMIGTLFYFGFFLLMPWWSQLGTPKPVPDRVTFKPH